jgi:hypothetical protein
VPEKASNYLLANKGGGISDFSYFSEIFTGISGVENFI